MTMRHVTPFGVRNIVSKAERLNLRLRCDMGCIMIAEGYNDASVLLMLQSCLTAPETNIRYLVADTLSRSVENNVGEVVTTLLQCVECPYDEFAMQCLMGIPNSERLVLGQLELLLRHILFEHV